MSHLLSWIRILLIKTGFGFSLLKFIQSNLKLAIYALQIICTYMSFVLSYLVKRYRNSEGLTTCIPRDKEDSGLTQKCNMAIFTIHLTVTRFSKILCLLCKKWVQIIPFWIDLSTVTAAPMIYCSFSCKTKYDEAAVYLKAVLYTSHYYLWQHEIVSGRLSFRGL